jgi:tight adherence protein C
MDIAFIIPPLIFVAVIAVCLAGYYTIRQSQTTLESRLTSGLAMGIGEVMTQELSQPFHERVLLPLLRQLGSLMTKATPTSHVEDARQRLIKAGKRSSTAFWTFFAVKTVSTILLPVGFVGCMWLVAGRLVLDWPYAIAFLVLIYIGWRLPDIWLDQTISSRKKGIVRKLPDALDLLTVCVEAGTALEAAFSAVVDKFGGPIRDEFGLSMREINLGKRRREALQDMAKRADVPELSSFVVAVVRAGQTGISISDVLRTQSDAMRVRRRQHAQEQAQKAPVKMLFPLILGIFPALFVVILGPAVIQTMKVLL